MQQQPISGDIGSLMAKGPPETHIEPSNTFHDATAHDLDISLKETIVIWDKKFQVAIDYKGREKHYLPIP